MRAANGGDVTRYDFEWDIEKARANRVKHGIGFEEAATIFSDPRMLAIYDDAHSESEDRWITMGASAASRVLVVCHTYRQGSDGPFAIRIFSARKATRRERKQYEE